jgi:hypothetical protein
VNRISFFGFVLLGLLAASAAAWQRSAQAADSSVSKSHAETVQPATQPLYQRQDTWYEFMLKQFNRDNFNYGEWVEQQRREFIESRVKNPYFLYSFGATLALLVAITICAKLSIDHRRTMWITAEMMADIYNQDAYSRQVARETIERYNKHIERCNRAIEAGDSGQTTATAGETEQLRSELMRVAEERDVATRDRDLARKELRQKSEILADMSLRLETLTAKVGANGTKASLDVRGADAKLVTHINGLQEQLYAEKTNNRRLKGG